LLNRFQNNPALVVGIARAIVTVLIIVGVNLSPEQEAAVVVIVQLLFTVITAKLTVPKVPTADAPAKSIQEPPS